MAEPAHPAPPPSAGFFAELRRRRVLPVAAVYLVGGGLLLELSGFLLEQAAAPGWIGRLLAIAFVVGFAVAVVIAWVLRREPGGGWALDSSRGQRRTVLGAIAVGVVITGLLAALLLPRFEDPPPVPDYDPLPHSVAVLPLLDPDYTPAELGIASILYEALTRGLNTSRELTQVQLKLKQAPADQLALGRQVRVVALLAGRILREAGETEVEMQLLDVARGVPFWTRRFAWDATRIMDRGTELANGVLQTLGLEPLSSQRFAGTDNREAYDALLMAQDLAFTAFRPVDLERSLPHFERAIELDPGYVQAYLDLHVVLSLMQMEGPSTLDDPARQRRAERRAWALETARTLAPDSPDVLSALGFEQIFVLGQGELALDVFRRVLEQEPDHARTLFRYAVTLTQLGRHEESLAVWPRVLELRPLDANSRGEYAGSLYLAGRTEQAKDEAQHALELEPKMAWVWLMLGYWESIEGRLDEAIIYGRKHLYVGGDSSMQLDRGCGWLLSYYAALGATKEAMARLEKCLEVVASLAEIPLDEKVHVIAPGRLFATFSLLRRHDLGIEYARQLLAAHPDHPILTNCKISTLVCGYRLLDYLRAGEPEQAWAFYRRGAPEVLARGDAILAGNEIRNDDFLNGELEQYAWLLLQIGEEDKARSLLLRLVEFLEEKCAGTTIMQRRTQEHLVCLRRHLFFGFLGQREETLAALRQRFIEDAVPYRPSFLEDHGALNFLHDDPEYQQIMQMVEDRLTTQRERVREMERNGELPMAQWEIEARQAAASLAQPGSAIGAGGQDERR